jgi:hypothetical protein
MMKSVTLSLLRSAANAFDFGGPVLCDAHHYGEGHINDTFVVWREDHSKRFILQRINTDTFTNPVGLMEGRRCRIPPKNLPALRKVCTSFSSILCWFCWP